MKIRSKGRITIEEAVKIGETMGIFEDEDIETIKMRDKKQQTRLILGRVTHDGERILRSIRAGDEVFYVDLTSVANRLELNLLIKAEEAKIRRSQSIVKKLKKIKGQVDGQIGLEEYYQEAL